MNELANRLKLTLQTDGGGAEIALKEVLKSELVALFRQYMTVDDVVLDIGDSYINVRVVGEGLKKVGYYCK